MVEFSIAAAQSPSVKGDIESNVRIHERFIRIAAEHDVHVVVFPELSLTGYEPELAGDLQIQIDDKRLYPISELARHFEMTIIIGAPLSSNQSKPYIGALVYGPDISVHYAKQHLHPGEEAFFSPGSRGCVIDVSGERLGLAICADISHASHAQNASQDGATLYAVGVLITESGYQEDIDLLQAYAKRHKMAVVMANHCSPTGGWNPAGKSAIWDENGNTAATSHGTDEALVIAEKGVETWRGTVIPV